MTRDLRITPARPDLADVALQGEVEAARYVEGVPHRVATPTAPLRRRPAFDAPLETEALFGEKVRVYESDAEGWSWVQLVQDGYVGYLPTDALASAEPTPTHWVSAQRSFLFPGPDIKLPPTGFLSFGSRVAVREIDGRFARIASGYLFAGHLSEAGVFEDDFVSVAGRFIGVPYLWGGRSSLGLDCSGLVQLSLLACGTPCPRDSDQQEAELGESVDRAGPFRRGDLLFWPGHVGIVEDERTLLHANAHHMAVAREPLSAALLRIQEAGTPLRAAKRFPVWQSG